MEFGIINLWNVIIFAIILIPNIVYAIKVKDNVSQKGSFTINMLEQIGLYGSMILMVVPIGVWKFGFSSVAEFFIYLVGNLIFVVIYLVTWGFYFKKRNLAKAMILAIAPTFIFMITGIVLRHVWLIIAAAIFGGAHGYITYKNNASIDA